MYNIYILFIYRKNVQFSILPCDIGVTKSFTTSRKNLKVESEKKVLGLN